MRIAYINVDWFKKSINTKSLIQERVDALNADLLIVLENIASFPVKEYPEVCHSQPLPTDKVFQYLDYGKYLNGEIPIRASIYSKYVPKAKIKVANPFSSVCCLYDIEGIEIAIYACVIGSFGIRYQKEIAMPELQCFIKDVDTILQLNKNLIVVGDLNTSFITSEKRELTQVNSREEILNLVEKYNMDITTKDLAHCIDHAIISRYLSTKVTIPKFTPFINTLELKDSPHFGLVVDIVVDAK
jgi:hypothetical protein